MASVLVTGGAGYIGSHVVKQLHEAGHEVTVYDAFINSKPDDNPYAEVIVGDVLNEAHLDDVFASGSFDAVVHMAAMISVYDSMYDPAAYYRNNVGGTVAVLRACVKHNVRNLVFSSTAAVYGENDIGEPISEEAPLHPLSPYGHSKAMAEQIIADVCRAHPLCCVTFRFFNVVGVDMQGCKGPPPGASHLFATACRTALGLRGAVPIYGTDWGTIDGTGVRDYIHVADLANAHVLGLEHLRAGGDSVTLNCGYGTGTSVLQVIQAIEKIIGGRITTDNKPRRPGDIGAIFADCRKIRGVLGWVPRYDDLETILGSAIAWEKALSEGGRV